MISTFKQVEMTRWVCEKPMKGSFDNAEITLIIKGPIRFWAIYTLKASKKNMVILYTMPYLQGLKRRKGLYIA